MLSDRRTFVNSDSDVVCVLVEKISAARESAANQYVSQMVQKASTVAGVSMSNFLACFPYNVIKNFSISFCRLFLIRFWVAPKFWFSHVDFAWEWHASYRRFALSDLIPWCWFWSCLWAWVYTARLIWMTIFVCLTCTCTLALSPWLAVGLSCVNVVVVEQNGDAAVNEDSPIERVFQKHTKSSLLQYEQYYQVCHEWVACFARVAFLVTWNDKSVTNVVFSEGDVVNLICSTVFLF